MVAMLSNVKIDSPSGCSMVAGTLNGASEPGQEVSDDTLVSCCIHTCVRFLFKEITISGNYHSIVRLY